MTSLVWTLVIGGLVGWLAGLLMKTGSQMGLLVTILVGIVGSWLGFWLSAVLGFRATDMAAGLIVRILGAMLLIVLLRATHLLR